MEWDVDEIDRQMLMCSSFGFRYKWKGVVVVALYGYTVIVIVIGLKVVCIDGCKGRESVLCGKWKEKSSGTRLCRMNILVS